MLHSTLQELTTALHSIVGGKSPGLDGFMNFIRKSGTSSVLFAQSINYGFPTRAAVWYSYHSDPQGRGPRCSVKRKNYLITKYYKLTTHHVTRRVTKGLSSLVATDRSYCVPDIVMEVGFISILK
jgi:hypothetical protein